jgi:peptidyl-prolyl isomerase G (cyclophilin G)
MTIGLFETVRPMLAMNFYHLFKGDLGYALDEHTKLHFKNTLFGRIHKGFMMQGGDIHHSDRTQSQSIYHTSWFEEEPLPTGTLDLNQKGLIVAVQADDKAGNSMGS